MAQVEEKRKKKQLEEEQRKWEEQQEELRLAREKAELQKQFEDEMLKQKQKEVGFALSLVQIVSDNTEFWGKLFLLQTCKIFLIIFKMKTMQNGDIWN